MNNISFKLLQKAAKERINISTSTPVAVMGDVATQFLSQAIKGYGNLGGGIALNILDIDYNTIDLQAMDPASDLYKFQPEFTIIYMSIEKLYEKFTTYSTNDRFYFAEKIIQYIKHIHSQILSNINTKIIQFNFIEKNDSVFGNYACKIQSSFLYQTKKLNYLFNEYISNEKNIYIADLSSICLKHGYNTIFDEKYYYSAKMTLSLEALPYVAKSCVDIINAAKGIIKKCVILDLDNTLWGGVIGDDGMQGIQIGELGTGRAFSDFQHYFKELKNRGIILAVCSKNNHDTAQEPFISHPDMVLSLDDISIFVANWEDKAANIRFIQETLNIGMDSIVFIDDNPFERNLVSSLIKDITVPDMPEDPAMYLDYIRSLNLFETISFSKDDENRTSLYKAEFSRKKLEQSFDSIDDYLKSLEMTAIVTPFEEFYYSRIAQLSQRSNQFNLRTVRYTDADIEAFSKNSEFITLSFFLKDKFGDHGLISVVILEKRTDHLFIDTWFMSCRVLKRGMEEFIINTIIKTAKQSGFNKIIGEYIPTAKNSMVKDIYKNLGFDKLDDSIFEAYVNNFQFNKTFIEGEYNGQK